MTQAQVSLAPCPLFYSCPISYSINYMWLFKLKCVCVCVCSVASDSLLVQGLQPTSLLCPQNFPGKNTGVGRDFLLQEIFPTQAPDPCLLCLLHWQVDTLPRCHLRSPNQSLSQFKLNKEKKLSPSVPLSICQVSISTYCQQLQYWMVQIENSSSISESST